MLADEYILIAPFAYKLQSGLEDKAGQQNITSNGLTLLSPESIRHSGLTNHGISAQQKALTVIGNSMRPNVFITAVFFFTVFSAAGQGCDEKPARIYLDSLFKNRGYISNDATQFPGYSKELMPESTPLLNKLLPGYCFFKTTFFSQYYEYREVQTLLAFSNSLSTESKLIHSPTFTMESQSFIQLFYGINLPDTSRCVTLANEIMSMLSDITYEGHFSRLINLREKSVISFELWHGDLSWRIYDFHFGPTHKLTRINIKGGVKRQEIPDDYKRQ